MTTELAQQLIKLCYAIAGVVAVVGTIAAYIEMNIRDDKEAKWHAKVTVGICILFFIVANVIEMIYL